MAQNRSKIGPEGSRNVILLRKNVCVFVHEILRFPILLPLFGPQDGAQEGPRSHQDGSKRVPAMIFNRIDFGLRFSSIWGPSWKLFGVPNSAPGVTPKPPLGSLGGLLGHFGCLLGPLGCLLGPLAFLLVRFGRLLGASCLSLGASWVSFGTFWRSRRLLELS